MIWDSHKPPEAHYHRPWWLQIRKSNENQLKMSKSNVRTSVTVSERRRLVPNPLGNVETKSWTCRKKKWQFENSNFEFKFRTVSKRQIVTKMSLKIWIWIQILIRPKIRLFLVQMPNTEDQNKNAAPGRGWTARASLSDFALKKM